MYDMKCHYTVRVYTHHVPGTMKYIPSHATVRRGEWEETVEIKDNPLWKEDICNHIKTNLDKQFATDGGQRKGIGVGGGGGH